MPEPATTPSEENKVMPEWIKSLSEQITKHGFATVIACILLGVLLWQAKGMVGDLKEQQKYTREKLTDISEKAIANSVLSTEAIKAATGQGKDVETAILANKDVIKDSADIIKDNTRVIDRVLDRLSEKSAVPASVPQH